MFEFVNLFLKMAETNFGRQTSEIEKAISGWPKKEEFDPNDKLVDWLTEQERFLASFYKGLAVPPAEDTEATSMYQKLEGMCLKYLELFHDLRNKILLHDGDASPRTGRIITSGKELLDSIKDAR